MLYLLDPIGASRRSCTLRAGGCRASRGLLRLHSFGLRDHAFELPWTPAFLHKHGGLVLSIGQFNQWVGSQLMASGLGADLAGHAGQPRRFSLGQRGRRAAPRRSGRRQNRCEPAEHSCPAWMCARS